jgi:hypothetical protein
MRRTWSAFLPSAEHSFFFFLFFVFALAGAKKEKKENAKYHAAAGYHPRSSGGRVSRVSYECCTLSKTQHAAVGI